MTVPPGGSTAADNPPPPRSDWPEDRRAGAVTDVPLLSRTAHDRGHLARSLPDPTQGRPVRVLRIDERRSVPVHEGPHGPELVYEELPTLPEGAIYLGEADGVPYAALRAPRSLGVGGRPVDGWAGLREVGAELGDLDAGLLAQAVGIDEVTEASRRWLAPAGLTAVVVGDADQAADQLRALGPVEVTTPAVEPGA